MVFPHLKSEEIKKITLSSLKFWRTSDSMTSTKDWVLLSQFGQIRHELYLVLCFDSVRHFRSLCLLNWQLSLLTKILQITENRNANMDSLSCAGTARLRPNKAASSVPDYLLLQKYKMLHRWFPRKAAASIWWLEQQMQTDMNHCCFQSAEGTEHKRWGDFFSTICKVEAINQNNDLCEMSHLLFENICLRKKQTVNLMSLKVCQPQIFMTFVWFI